MFTKSSRIRRIRFQGSSLEVLNIGKELSASGHIGLTTDEIDTDDSEPPSKKRKFEELPELSPDFITLSSELLELVHIDSDEIPPTLTDRETFQRQESEIFLFPAPNARHAKPGKGRKECRCHSCLRTMHDITGGLLYIVRRPGFPEMPISISQEDVEQTSLRMYSWRSSVKRSYVWKLLQRPGAVSVLLKVEVRWHTSELTSIFNKTWRNDPFLSFAIDILLYEEADAGSSMMPKDLYSAAHIPTKNANNERPLQPFTGMKSDLLPFQNRAVHWLLQRENMALDDTRGIVPRTRPSSIPVYFQQAKDYYGNICYVSVLLGRVTKDREFVLRHRDYLSGGILAEEMGLGKTVEVIALICLNKMREDQKNPLELASGNTLVPTKATLIITPSALLGQWESELEIHAPHLSVMTYEGIRGIESTEEVAALKSKLLEQDVVLMTYNTLSFEIHYSSEVPDRALRHEKRYELKRSPLIETLWYRVVLDEAQMVESTASNVARLAQLLPRRNAWAVTGTPVRKDMKDVHGLLAFLRYEPFSDKYIWERLITSCRTAFKDIFSSICIRHTKGGVHDEIALPPQKRYAMTIPFTKVEQEHYQELFRQMCADCDLNEDGSPAKEDWDPESPSVVSKMRSWLLRLRQACSHPDIGIMNRRAHGVTGGPLRTVEEVLEAMIEQNQKAIGVDERSYITSKLKQGLLLATLGKSQAALNIWTIALTRTGGIVSEARKELGLLSGNSENGDQSTTLFGVDPDENGTEEENTAAEARKKATTSLRHALELQHGSIFFSANAHFQMKDNVEITEPDSEQWKTLDKKENDLYEEAKVVRRELLHEVAGKAQQQMKILIAKARAQSFVDLPDLQELTARGGIEIRSLLEKTETLVEGINAQSEVIDIWREQLIQLLLKPLVDSEAEGIELKGDEIDASAKDQEQVFVYMTALRTIVAERAAFITGEKNALTEQEVKQMTIIAKEGNGPDPKKLLELFELSEKLKNAVSDAGSLRAIISDMRSKVTTLREDAEESRRAAIEKALAETCMKNLQAIVSSQMKTHTALEAELTMYRNTMNAKVEYYRQLQRLSDAVADFQDLKQPEKQLKELEEKEPQLLQQIATKKSRGRYLLNLRMENVNASEKALCVICQTEFQTGALTICGHQFCKDCIIAWWREHRSCPLCKKKLTRGDFHPITLKSRELKARELSGAEAATQSDLNGNKNVSVYSGVSGSMMDEIRQIELHGSFGTKVNTISRHLLWIRRNAPGTKSVIFSLRSQFLRILMDAFRRFGIRYSSLLDERGAEKFRKDPEIECFLLDAAQHSSGLNLTTASNVFLCEPLINTAVELQAVARVHRIGQKQATSVWVYVINGTVEESIFEIASSRRAKYLKTANSKDSTEKDLEDLDTIEFQKKSINDMLTRQGGESVDKEDLWACLFQKIDASFRPDPDIDREIIRELQSRAVEIRHR